jgi:hypothetical protein
VEVQLHALIIYLHKTEWLASSFDSSNPEEISLLTHVIQELVGPGIDLHAVAKKKGLYVKQIDSVSN